MGILWSQFRASGFFSDEGGESAMESYARQVQKADLQNELGEIDDYIHRDRGAQPKIDAQC